jgi:hypothetical protein
MKKYFVLGVGAQKSGTTWLYRYLSNNENVNFGALKEYHIWDALHIKECKNFVAYKEDKLRYYLQNNNGAYEEYFASLICNGINVTGDITPSYSGLSVDCFRLIKRKVESIGFDLRVVFLMRDPFERCWSAVRMDRLKKNVDITEIHQLRAAYRSADFFFRTAYNLTIEALESAFSKEQLYFGIYEELFEVQKIEEISNFIGVPFKPEFARKKFNVSSKMNDDAVILKSEIRDFYSEVYDFCFERFPQTKLLWV